MSEDELKGTLRSAERLITELQKNGDENDSLADFAGSDTLNLDSSPEVAEETMEFEEDCILTYFQKG